jgi:hypothetical protein
MDWDYSTCKRKCKHIGESEKLPEHDYRKHFYWSAKAMEPHVAKRLVDSAIFESATMICKSHLS